MSRDLLGEFGDFTSSSSNLPSRPTPATSTDPFASFGQFTSGSETVSSSSNARPQSKNFDGILGLFDSSSTATKNTSSVTAPSPAAQYQNNDAFSVFQTPPRRPPIQASSSEAIISGFSPMTTPAHKASTGIIFEFGSPASVLSQSTDNDDDEFGDFAEEPLPSTISSYGPPTNSSLSPEQPKSGLAVPPQPVTTSKPQTTTTTSTTEDDFGELIYTPRIPTPPPQQTPFSLSTPLADQTYLHPQHPPPPLHILLPHLSNLLLAPFPFLQKLKALQYAQRQRLLSQPSVRTFFTGLIYITHIIGRLIASQKIRPRRSYNITSNNNNNSKLKLTGSNRADVLKDKREISEVVRIYTENVGSIRAAVAGMGRSGITVPDLSVDMGITTVSSPPSSSLQLGSTGRSTPTASARGRGEAWCWLCGLSSQDVIPKLKEEGDSISNKLAGNAGGKVSEERWVAGWGHRSCRNWWEESGVQGQL